jgi:hypothetical protein
MFSRPALASIARHIVARLLDASTTEMGDAALRDYCSAFILEFAMNEVVERILNAYQSMCPLDAERAADSRQNINRY